MMRGQVFTLRARDWAHTWLRRPSNMAKQHKRPDSAFDPLEVHRAISKDCHGPEIWPKKRCKLYLLSKPQDYGI
jgi:hypothetical protein